MRWTYQWGASLWGVRQHFSEQKVGVKITISGQQTTGKAPLECNLSLFFPRAAPSSTPATKLVRAPQMNTSRTFNEALLFYELSDENDLCSLPSHPFMCSLLVAKLVSSVVHPGSSQIRGK